MLLICSRDQYYRDRAPPCIISIFLFMNAGIIKGRWQKEKKKDNLCKHSCHIKEILRCKKLVKDFCSVSKLLFVKALFQLLSQKNDGDVILDILSHHSKQVLLFNVLRKP